MRLLLTVCFLGLVGCHRGPDRSTPLNLSAADQAQITALIKSETNEPIIMLFRDPDDPALVKVHTGFSDKAFASAGKSFSIKRTMKQWIVVRRGSWES